MSSTEDPRILTRTQFCFEMRDLVDTLRLADQDSIRHRIDQSDRAQRERIATLEEKVRLLECALKISATDANARMNEGNELRADNRRLREALELWQKFYSLASANAPFMQKAVDAMETALQPAAPPTCKDSLQVQPTAPQLSGEAGEKGEPR